MLKAFYLQFSFKFSSLKHFHAEKLLVVLLHMGPSHKSLHQRVPHGCIHFIVKEKNRGIKNKFALPNT
jgi:hypothetical protein